VDLGFHPPLYQFKFLNGGLNNISLYRTGFRNPRKLYTCIYTNIYYFYVHIQNVPPPQKVQYICTVAVQQKETTIIITDCSGEIFTAVFVGDIQNVSQWS
jgi:hypothetical protein